MPTFAQQKDTADPQLREALIAYNKTEDGAWNNNDAVALAAFYAEDAILVNDTGPIYGREAIEKHYAAVLKQVQFSNHLEKGDQYSPHIIGTAGNEVWGNGEWSDPIQGKSGDPIQIKG